MDRPFLQDCEIDLENGGSSSTSEEERCTVNVNHSNKFLGRVWSGPVGFDGSYDCRSPEVKVENEESMSRKKSSCNRGDKLEEGEKVKEKRSSKKPPKPPRGPSLDAADLKLIKEISQLAMLKRARVERMKALKKMKAAKSTSQINSSLYATVITILFCLVIVFQGTCSKSSSHVSFEGSPEMSVANNGGQISNQYYKNLPYGNTEGPGSLPPNFIEEISRSSTQEVGSRLVG
ncbi:hypothetical protein ACHQM5_026203 [Ranunculus cassubicifolius]